MTPAKNAMHMMAIMNHPLDIIRITGRIACCLRITNPVPARWVAVSLFRTYAVLKLLYHNGHPMRRENNVFLSCQHWYQRFLPRNGLVPHHSVVA